MRQRSGILRILCLVAVIFLTTFVASGARAQYIALVGYGSAFEEPGFVKDFMGAIDWSSLTADIFEDPLFVVLYPPIGEPVDNFSAQKESKEEDALEELKGQGVKFTLLYIYVPEIADLAAKIPEQLDSELRVIEVGSVFELTEYLKQLKEKGSSVLVLAYVP